MPLAYEQDVHNQECANYSKSVDMLPDKQHVDEQADIRMHSHGLQKLVDENSVAICHQTTI